MKKKQSKPVSVLRMVAAELLYVLIAFPFYVYLVSSTKRQAGALPGLMPPISPDAITSLAFLSVFGVIIVCIGVVAALSMLFGPEQFRVDAVYELLRTYSTRDLVIIYIVAGFAEEFLFRVTLLGLFGLLVSTVLFTAVHAAYWHKPLMLVYVFVAGLALGMAYQYTGSLVLCAFAHAGYNLAVSLLMKAGLLPLNKVDFKKQ